MPRNIAQMHAASASIAKQFAVSLQDSYLDVAVREGRARIRPYSVF